MIGGPRPRRPIKVVVLVVGCWLVGQLLQAGFASLFAGSDLFGSDGRPWPALIAAWGLLFVIAFVFRERIDDWLRS